jgi:phosphoglycerate dehydrogenase-like enzyme
MDHPIRLAPNTVFSTHRAGAIREAFLNIGRMVANDTEAIVKGLPPREMQLADPAFIELRSVAGQAVKRNKGGKGS